MEFLTVSSLRRHLRCPRLVLRPSPPHLLRRALFEGGHGQQKGLDGGILGTFRSCLMVRLASSWRRDAHFSRRIDGDFGAAEVLPSGVAWKKGHIAHS